MASSALHPEIQACKNHKNGLWCDMARKEKGFLAQFKKGNPKNHNLT
jgi:hypothetical protein